MDERTRSRLVYAAAAVLALAVAWDALGRLVPRRPPPTPVPAVAGTRDSQAASPAPAAASAVSQGGGVPPEEPGYMTLLARSDTRRRIRASGDRTYLNEMLAASADSTLHRWDNRIADPVRVYVTPGTVANWKPEFAQQVRVAFERWEAAGVPVRFTFLADSVNVEVMVRWKIQFEIERTGQTDVAWDPDGHLQEGTITIATFDPKGVPLGAEDVRLVALHEVGHLLGLDHSPDSTDVMFANGGARDLSPRDIQTALLLYQLPPGSLR